jgi:hypothetical protein
MVEADVTGGLFGSALIGMACVLLLASHGRIAGTSGILYGVFARSNDTDHA